MSDTIPDCSNNPIDEWDDLNDDEEFIPCSRCDGYPACEDFGCAYALGLGRLVSKEPGADFDD